VVLKLNFSSFLPVYCFESALADQGERPSSLSLLSQEVVVTGSEKIKLLYF